MRRESGQAAVETAIVMPLFIFVLLGLFQLMLAHQARLLTKYAAYKAVRAGSLHRADVDKMKDAALAVLLPVAGDINSDRVYNVREPGLYKNAWGILSGNRYAGSPIADVTICGPLSGHTSPDVDFDDPNSDGVGNTGWAGNGVHRSKLSIQVTFYYRLVIPFANWGLWWMTYAKESSENVRSDDVVRLGQAQSTGRARETSLGNSYGERTIRNLRGMADAHMYVLPIRSSWTARMQSNVGEGLPGSNECKISWAKAN